MYYCELCGTFFDKPHIRTYKDHTVDPRAEFQEVVCPVCLEPHIEEAAFCPACDQPMPVGPVLCESCRMSLKRRVTEFFDTLTAEEEQQFDTWMDGRSITERRAFP